jgi:outer membrane protein assembly factor BamB
MKLRWSVLAAAACCVTFAVQGEDWPQWRGPNRDAKALGFKVPASWPRALKQQWKVSVGDGVANPSLVGDRLYVIALQNNREVIRCLNADDGKELWKDEYEAKPADGPASGFAGSRATPVVASGKVVTLGVSGTISCLEAATGKVVWRKEDPTGRKPRFYTSSSPLIVNGLAVVQCGGEGGGAIMAFDLNTGSEKWSWAGDGTAYASPVLQDIEGLKTVVAETANNIVGLNAQDGTLLWQVPFPLSGAPGGGGGRGGRTYNSSTPVIEGDVVLFSGGGRGTHAYRIEKQGEKCTAKEVWKNMEVAVMYNTPVVKDGLIFGLTATDALFCLDFKTGKLAWSHSLLQAGGGGPPAKGGSTPPGQGQPPRKGGGQGRGMRSQPGYGSIVDAGPVLLALTPRAQLLVYEPAGKAYKQIASYKVADSQTFSYPIIDDNRIYVKDQDSVILWTVE